MLARTRPALGYAGSRERWLVTHPHPVSMRKPEGMCCLLGDEGDPGDFSEDSNLHLKERLPLGWKPQDSVSPGGGESVLLHLGPPGSRPQAHGAEEAGHIEGLARKQRRCLEAGGKRSVMLNPPGCLGARN